MVLAKCRRRVEEEDRPDDRAGDAADPSQRVAAADAEALAVGGSSRVDVDVPVGPPGPVGDRNEAQPVRRIGKLVVDLDMPAVPEEARAMLERAAHTCPVHQSLHPDVELDIRFRWA